MAFLKSLVLGLIGLAASVLVFDRAAQLLAGNAWTWTAHLAVAALGCLFLGLALRSRSARAALGGFGIGLLLLTAASLVAFPALVRSQALVSADGRPFCLLGPEVRSDPADRKSDYRLQPALSDRAGLTYLTMPRPLTLVVELPVPAPDPVPRTRRDDLYAELEWNGRDRRFDEVAVAWLEDGGSKQVDCLPQADPFDAAASAGLAVTVLWRERLPDENGLTAWGARERTVHRLGPELAPEYRGRFRSAGLGFSAPLLPDSDPLPVEIAWVSDVAGWMDQRRDEQVWDQDRPLDWSTLPMAPHGLVAYEVPSTSVAGAVDGTYLLLGAGGALQTVIACDSFFCRHHLPLDPAFPVVISITYPRDLLPRWQQIGDAAHAKAAATLRPDG